MTLGMRKAFVNSAMFKKSSSEVSPKEGADHLSSLHKAIKVAASASHRGFMVRTRSRLLLEVLEVLSAPYSVLSRLMPQMAALAIIIAITAYVFMYFQHIDLVSAVYASVGLVTTIGLYTPPLSAMSSSEKLSLTVLVLASVATYTTIVMNIVSTVTRRTVWIDARARWRASHVKDHVIVLGDMPEVATELDRMGVEYVMVTNNESLAASLQNHRVIIGNPTSERELRAAGVEFAAVVIIALDNDSDSLTALIRVRKLNPNVRTVVLVHNEDLTDVFLDAGASQVVRLKRFIGRALAGMALSGHLGGVLLESTEGSSKALREAGYGIGFFKVEKGSRCDGMALKELPKGVIPVLVERNEVFTPYFSTDFKLKEGDGLVVLGDPTKFTKIRELCSAGVS